MKADFTIAGLRKRLTSEQVVRKLRNIEPGAVRTHGVRVHGTVYPAKEAFAIVTGLDPLDFNTIQARTLFRRLGFQVIRVPKKARRS